MITDELEPSDLRISINVEGKTGKIIDTFDTWIDFWDAVEGIRDEKFPDLDSDDFGKEFIKDLTDEEIYEFILDKILWTGYYSDLTDMCYSHLNEIVSKNVNIRKCYIFKISSLRWMGKIFDNRDILLIEESHPFDNAWWREQPA